MKKKPNLLLVFGLTCAMLSGCNNNTIDELKIEPTQIDLNENNQIKLKLISKDLSHSIELDTEEPTSTNSIEKKDIETKEDSTLISIGMTHEIASSKNLTLEEKNAILKQIEEYKITDKDSLNNLVELIDNNIASFDLRERDLIIKKYMLSLYDSMNNLNSILSVIGYDLEYVVKTYHISVNDKTSIESIPNTYGTVKGFLLEVKDKGFFINSINKNKDFYIDLDLAHLSEKYEDYISQSMLSYIEFNNYEMNNTLSLSKSNTYDLDEISNRINTLSQGLEFDKQNNYILVDKYTSSLNYYYQLLLGLSHTQFVNSKNVFNDDIINKYKEIQAANPDTMLADVLEKIILAIETNEKVYDDNIKVMVNEYVNSLIYTKEITNAINSDINSKYVILETEKEEVSKETKDNTKDNTKNNTKNNVKNNVKKETKNSSKDTK